MRVAIVLLYLASLASLAAWQDVPPAWRFAPLGVLIAINAAVSLRLLWRSERAAILVLLISAAQLALFTVALKLGADVFGDGSYRFDAANPQWADWSLLTAVHVLRASDFMDALDAYRINLQTIHTVGYLSGSIVVLLHLLTDFVMFAALWRLVRGSRVTAAARHDAAGSRELLKAMDQALPPLGCLTFLICGGLVLDDPSSLPVVTALTLLVASVVAVWFTASRARAFLPTLMLATAAYTAATALLVAHWPESISGSIDVAWFGVEQLWRGIDLLDTSQVYGWAWSGNWTGGPMWSTWMVVFRFAVAVAFYRWLTLLLLTRGLHRWLPLQQVRTGAASADPAVRAAAVRAMAGAEPADAVDAVLAAGAGGGREVDEAVHEVLMGWGLRVAPLLAVRAERVTYDREARAVAIHAMGWLAEPETASVLRRLQRSADGLSAVADMAWREFERETQRRDRLRRAAQLDADLDQLERNLQDDAQRAAALYRLGVDLLHLRNDPAVEATVARAIAVMAAPLRDPSVAVRRQVIDALAIDPDLRRLGGSDLARAATEDPDAGVRAAALRVLPRHPDVIGHYSLWVDATDRAYHMQRVLESGLADPDAGVRMAAIGAAKEHRALALRASLAQLGEHDPDPTVAATARELAWRWALPAGLEAPDEAAFIARLLERIRAGGIAAPPSSHEVARPPLLHGSAPDAVSPVLAALLSDGRVPPAMLLPWNSPPELAGAVLARLDDDALLRVMQPLILDRGTGSTDDGWLDRDVREAAAVLISGHAGGRSVLEPMLRTHLARERSLYLRTAFEKALGAVTQGS
ncbi:MAG: hypothetical protein AB7K09_00390 [Planctomycetota bacterium]